MNKPSRWMYLLPLAMYFGLALIYLKAIPPGESPDEPSHLQCIEQVTRYNRIPIIDPQPQGNIWWARERIISGLVCAHMPLYYFLAGYTQQVVEKLTGISAHYEFPPNNPKWATGASPAMFEHPPVTLRLQTTEPMALTVLRLESILLGLASLIAAALIARRIAPAAPYAGITAMTLVAGWPQFVFMSRAINNDALAVALSVGVIAVLVNVGRPNRFIAASLLSALAILSKFTMIFSAGAVLATFALELMTAQQRRSYWRAGLISLGIFGALAALLLLQPTLRSHIEWTQATMSDVNGAANTPAYWQDVLNLTLQSGWARLGWMNVPTPDGQAFIWWAGIILTSVIGAIAGMRRSNQPTARFATLIALIWLAAVLVVYASINLNRFQPQFRYAFSMAPVLAALAATGLLTLFGQHENLKRAAAPAIAFILVLANLWIIAEVIIPAYT